MASKRPLASEFSNLWISQLKRKILQYELSSLKYGGYQSQPTNILQRV